MENRPDPPADNPGAPDIADASALFADAPTPQPARPPSAPATEGEAGQYDLEDVAEPAARPPVPVFPDESPSTRARPGDRPRSSQRPPREPSEAVEQVWSRSAEWGASIAQLLAAGAGLLVVLYVMLTSEMFGLALLTLVAGGLGMVVLSYPILITLERPVRVTPEQAVADFYAALSHHAPHYKRMWLLLSSAGRVSGSFGSFEGFRSYWSKRLTELKAGRASGFTPLKFEVAEFRSDKSAGRTEIAASYTVRVYVRGRHAEGPVEQFRVSTTLVKGPDRMWYLDSGTLP